MRPVAMLEGQDKAAAGIVIGENRPGAIERRLPHGAGAAQCAVGYRVFERITAAFAGRRRQEYDTAPAIRA